MNVGSIYEVEISSLKPLIQKAIGVCTVADDGEDGDDWEPSWRIDFPNGGCQWVKLGQAKKLFFLFHLLTYFKVLSIS